MVVETDGVTPIIPAENVADCAKKRAANMHQTGPPTLTGISVDPIGQLTPLSGEVQPRVRV